MGGTLPAIARAAQADDDLGRRRLGWLYGVNTLGAVTGCVAANFWLLETLGTRRTLFAACAVNALVAGGAWWLSRGTVAPTGRSEGERLGHDGEGVAREVTDVRPIATAVDPSVARFAVMAAAVAGFSFFVMEIVWYRMLGPLLGGTVFTFGLILAVALLGVGLGGAFYGLLEKGRRPSLASFAITSVLEALCMARPLRARRSRGHRRPRAALARNPRLSRASVGLGARGHDGRAPRGVRGGRAVSHAHRAARLGFARRRATDGPRLRRQHGGGHRGLAARRVRLAARCRRSRMLARQSSRFSSCSVFPRRRWRPRRASLALDS